MEPDDGSCLIQDIYIFIDQNSILVISDHLMMIILEGGEGMVLAKLYKISPTWNKIL